MTTLRSCTRSPRASASCSPRSCCAASSPRPASSNFFNTISMTLLPIFLLRELGLSPASMGIIFALGAVGGLVGAMATPHIVGWIGEARAIPVSASGSASSPCSSPWPRWFPPIAFPLLVAQGFVASFTVLLYNITQVTFRQRITPPRLLGRMNASVRFVVWGVMPIAALLSGALGTWIGVVATMWIGAIGQLLAAGFVVIGPFWALGELPDEMSHERSDRRTVGQHGERQQESVPLHALDLGVFDGTVCAFQYGTPLDLG